jgi:hypothetical protein
LFLRSFSDVYQPVPPAYLSWLVRSHLASNSADVRAKAEIAVSHFRPTRTSENLTMLSGQQLTKAFSWSLFVPNEVSLAETEVYGALIGKDPHYRKTSGHAPKTLAEAKQGGLYGDGKSFFAKYVDAMLDGLAWISKHLSGWGVIVHLAPELEWLEPVLLKSGIVRVGLMGDKARRTSGAFWRWIPMDDKSLDIVIAVDADDCAVRRGVLLFTVTFYANHAHNLTRSPYHL